MHARPLPWFTTRTAWALVLLFWSLLFASSAFAQTVDPSVQALVDAIDAATAIPTAQDLATVWAGGFTLVVGCYAIGRAVGTVVNFIR
jgi:hypothetical protein